MSTFAAQLKAWRQKQALSQAEAAKFLDMPKGTYQHWEQAVQVPSQVTQRLIIKLIEAARPRTPEEIREELSKMNQEVKAKILSGDRQTLRQLAAECGLDLAALLAGRVVRSEAKHTANRENGRWMNQRK
jgi:DNA-binding XRE family transcriptional regulator